MINDTSPLVVNEINTSNGILKFREALTFQPSIDVSGKILYIENHSLGIYVSGRSREQLLSELIEELEFLWKEYAQEKDENLNIKALELKKILLNLFI